MLRITVKPDRGYFSVLVEKAAPAEPGQLPVWYPVAAEVVASRTEQGAIGAGSRMAAAYVKGFAQGQRLQVETLGGAVTAPLL
jgi:hypothetical protein